MKNSVKSWLVTLAVIFTSALGANACGDDDVVNLILLELGTYENAIADHVESAAGGCENSVGCDGMIPDFDAGYSVEGGETGDTYTVSFGTEDNTVTRTSGQDADDVEQALVDEINNNSRLGRAALLNSFGVYLRDPSSGDSIEGSVEGTGELNSLMFMGGQSDTEALFNLLFGSSNIPDNQDLIDEAVTEEKLDLDEDESGTGTIVGNISYDCDNEGGRVNITQTFTGTAVGTLSGANWDSTERTTESTIFAYTNCEISGDILDDGAPAGVDPGTQDESITVHGTMTSIFTETPDEDEGEIREDYRIFGTLTLTTTGGGDDDGSFWTDSAVANVTGHQIWPMSMGPGPSEEQFDGGMCFGAGVASGPDGTDDYDDDCAAGGDRYIPGSALINLIGD